MLNIEFRISVSDNEGSRDRVLRILLWTLIRLNREYLRMNPNAPWLYNSGVRFIREKEGEEIWPTIGEVIRMGGGDCEDLACWRVAELLEREHVEARPAWRHREVRLPSGQVATLYHILVYRGDTNQFEDPSRILGMGGPSDR